MNKPNENLKAYWTGLSTVNPNTRLRVFGQEGDEFAPNAGELVIRGEASRRKFMGLLGASTALAGITTTGCIRKPRENIMPFAKRPEDMIPGRPVYYATAAQIGATVQGLLVESYDGRPIKVEGNPQHPGSGGATDVFAQALILGLYDPERSARPRSRTIAASVPTQGKAVSADQAKAAGIEVLAQEAYDRVLKATRSIDAAQKAKEKLIQQANQKAVVRAVKGEKGDEYAVTYTGEELLEVTWPTAWATFDEAAAAIGQSQGDKLAIVVHDTMSPTLRWRLIELATRLPKAQLFISDPAAAANTAKAAELLAGAGARTYYSLNSALTIFSADADFLGVDADHTRLNGEFAKNRQISQPGDPMSRLYVAEAQFSNTGASADHRVGVRSSQVVDILRALVRSLVDDHKRPVPTGAEGLIAAIKAPELGDPKLATFVKVLAKDLAEKGDKGVVLVGERQPLAAHSLGLVTNALLGSLGRGAGAQRLRSVEPVLKAQGLTELAQGLDQGTLTKVVFLGTNSVYTAPGSLALAAKLAKAELVIHAGHYFDETAQFAHVHVPVSHELESWGDLEAADGTRSICQPLIAPLHDTPSVLELVERLAQPGTTPIGHDLVKAYWTRELGDRGLSDKQWRRWLHDGVINEGLRVRSVPAPTGWDRMQAELAAAPAADLKSIEINFYLDPKIHAGEFANNAWLQECPHPLTKLVWDNAAYLSLNTAQALKVKNGDLLSIKIGDRSVAVPVWISYGQADHTVVLNLGYGRKHCGTVAEGAGFDVNPLRSPEKPHFEAGDVSRGSGTYLLVTTQDFGQLDPDGTEGIGFMNYGERPIYRETTVEGFKKDKDFSKKGDVIPPQNLKVLWERPKFTGAQQWGMNIDLNLCTGCNACVVACQAENNIAVVGKGQCANGREMHWMRIDRYYRGDLANPEAVVMPMLCQHCETAPCENVCPVQATAHSPEGLNDMAYNRCVGTRYCANNCPYKVRRFNFFNYNIDMPELTKMSKNPDVTVRFRGVIEKCSYCVQRINAAKIEAHSADKDTVTDGNIVTACAQVCPAGAIVFGDVKDPNTRVSKLKAQSRDYAVLNDLYTAPRTTYLGRVRNPNPELG